ncbi:MAG: ATPase, T2SS/T4P/T4SS family [Catenibacterium sp.]
MVPQTGAFHYYLNEHIYFLRVSYLPGMDFESIVIRILNNHENITINEISEIDDFTFYLNEVCYQKSGLFLVAGATGSGKSTTLYAILDKIIEMGGRNVVTLEDPIEIVKEHCLQIEMNESMGIDYYNSLKQILRHDPDVIMIGEIRDEKTAKLAITCALTGHLVLSTIHASNSLLVIKRMLNLGINETDLEDVLIGVVTQRIKYDRRNRKVIILPETMNRNQIKTYFLDHTVSYPSFKDNALMLIKEKHCDQYLFKDELNGQ